MDQRDAHKKKGPSESESPFSLSIPRRASPVGCDQVPVAFGDSRVFGVSGAFGAAGAAGVGVPSLMTSTFEAVDSLEITSPPPQSPLAQPDDTTVSPPQEPHDDSTVSHEDSHDEWQLLRWQWRRWPNRPQR